MARKRDLRRVDAVLAEFGVTGHLALQFRDYLHECKDSGDFGSAGGKDHTMEELRDLVREFLDHRGIAHD